MDSFYDKITLFVKKYRSHHALSADGLILVVCFLFSTKNIILASFIPVYIYQNSYFLIKLVNTFVLMGCSSSRNNGDGREQGLCVIEVIRCEHLPNMDVGSLTDAYVKVRFIDTILMCTIVSN